MRIFTRIGWGSMAAEQEPGPIRSTKTGSGRSQRSAGPVSGEPPGILIVGGGTELAAGTLVWTVGGTANPLASASDLPVDKAGRVRVTERLPVTGVPDAYAAGDSAVVPDLTQPGGLRGQPPRPYRHWYLGSVATLGRRQGVTQVYRLRLHGFIAWLIARGYHLAWVPTLNHKARILADWAISMFSTPTRSRSATLSIPSRSSCGAGHQAIHEEPPMTPAVQVTGLLTR